MTTQSKVDALIQAQEILMEARIAALRLAPVHDKLCRVMDYLDEQAAELLESTNE